MSRDGPGKWLDECWQRKGRKGGSECRGRVKDNGLEFDKGGIGLAKERKGS